jgi:hypothetical protein
VRDGKESILGELLIEAILITQAFEGGVNFLQG